MRFWRRYRPARAVKPASVIRPRLEVLEDRCVPSIDLVTNLSGSALVSGSLPFEVANAAKGDTIQFAPSLHGATINLGSTLDINKDLAIDGAGSGITVNGGGNRVFVIEQGVSADINALTITGGATTGISNGGGIYNKGDLGLTNSTVTGNSATSGGGGIFNAPLATMTMSSDTVNNNTAASLGGGVDNFGTLTIINCTIAANNANLGGGIANNAILNLVNSTVASNTVTGAGADGGGIYNGGGQLALLDTIVYNPNSGAATNDEVLGPTT